MRSRRWSSRRTALTGLIAVSASMSFVLAPTRATAASIPTACYVISGVVSDPFGIGIGGATVVAQDPQGQCVGDNVATTASNASFSVQIPYTDSSGSTETTGDSAEASAPGYASETKLLYPTCVECTSNDLEKENSFQLLYPLTATSSPQWTQSGGTINISAQTGTPPAPALNASGYACAWGYNGDGSLGNGSTTNTDLPVQVNGVGGSGMLDNVLTSSTAGYMPIAELGTGGALSWGDRTGAASNPSQVPGLGGVGTLSGVTSVSAGNLDKLFLLSNGTVAVWQPAEPSSTPTLAPGVGGVGNLIKWRRRYFGRRRRSRPRPALERAGCRLGLQRLGATG
jgi:hypothetical protein